MRRFVPLALTAILLFGCQGKAELPTGEQARDAVSEAAREIDSALTTGLDSLNLPRVDSLRAQAESLRADVRDRVGTIPVRRDTL